MIQLPEKQNKNSQLFSVCSGIINLFSYLCFSFLFSHYFSFLFYVFVVSSRAVCSLQIIRTRALTHARTHARAHARTHTHTHLFLSQKCIINLTCGLNNSKKQNKNKKTISWILRLFLKQSQWHFVLGHAILDMTEQGFIVTDSRTLWHSAYTLY